MMTGEILVIAIIACGMIRRLPCEFMLTRVSPSIYGSYSAAVLDAFAGAAVLRVSCLVRLCIIIFQLIQMRRVSICYYLLDADISFPQ